LFFPRRNNYGYLCGDSDLRHAPGSSDCAILVIGDVILFVKRLQRCACRLIRNVAILSALLLALNPVQASTEDSLRGLEQEQVLVRGGIGIPGIQPIQRPRQYDWFQELMTAPNRIDLLHELYSHSSTVGKCYALMGLYWLKQSDAESLAQQLVQEKAEFESCSCDVFNHEKVDELLPTLRSGYFMRTYLADLTKKLEHE
jgi:hypothetical protein